MGQFFEIERLSMLDIEDFEIANGFSSFTIGTQNTHIFTQNTVPLILSLSIPFYPFLSFSPLLSLPLSCPPSSSQWVILLASLFLLKVGGPTLNHLFVLHEDQNQIRLLKCFLCRLQSFITPFHCTFMCDFTFYL